MFDLKVYLRTRKQKIDASLRELWSDVPPSPTPLLKAMRYSLDAGGKRLRPILCLAASEAVGGLESEVIPAACALELIHTYSLIHDDLPAMDDDGLRRGKPTCHIAFDEATAILAGDALLTAAFELLAAAGRRVENNPAKWLEVIEIISGAAGHAGMVQGQMMDLSAEGRVISAEELEGLHRFKTGALIEASVKTGAVLGGGQPEQVEALGTYSRHIGLAFQLADDILNIEGKPEILGKPVGSDQNQKKATGPASMGLEQAKMRAEELIIMAVDEMKPFGPLGKPLASLARYVIERQK
jgi:geranylgeranyl diphosphate synthase type II